MKWAVPLAANLIGQSHLAEQSECQDAYCIRHSPDGEWIAICVCDGAGSAIYGGEGARFVSEEFSQRLVDISAKLSFEPPGAWINDGVISAILDIRAKLGTIAGKNQINEYHATLVAVLVGSSGGFAVHIGDGAIFGGCFSEIDKSPIKIDEDYFVSPPENGEYANETFFITESDWIKHLRITPLPSLDWLALATDGGCAFSLTPKNGLNSPFVTSLFANIVSNGAGKPTDIIAAEMRKERYKRLTNDDKTLVLLFDEELYRSKVKKFALKDSDTASDTISPDPKRSSASQNIQRSTPNRSTRRTLKPKSPTWLLALSLALFFGLIGGVTGYSIKQNAVSQAQLFTPMVSMAPSSDVQEPFLADGWFEHQEKIAHKLPPGAK